MITIRLLMSGLIAFGLALAPTGVLAAEPHAHAAKVEIMLDNGKKWPTDAALRQGMGEIRVAIAGALARIHSSEFPRGEFEQLAAKVQAQVDYVTANAGCPRRPITSCTSSWSRFLDGIAAMKADTGQTQGAVQIVQALELYGTHFDHAGWQPLAH